MFLIFTKPIFHYAFVSHVGADKARHFAFGKFEIFFSQREIFNLEKHMHNHKTEPLLRH